MAKIETEAARNARHLREAKELRRRQEQLGRKQPPIT